MNTTANNIQVGDVLVGERGNIDSRMTVDEVYVTSEGVLVVSDGEDEAFDLDALVTIER
jgi:mannose-6-phosphate isomerase-like protein (cupin superfamily)